MKYVRVNSSVGCQLILIPTDNFNVGKQESFNEIKNKINEVVGNELGQNAIVLAKSDLNKPSSNVLKYILMESSVNLTQSTNLFSVKKSKNSDEGKMNSELINEISIRKYDKVM